MPKRNIVWIVVGALIAVLVWKAPESYSRRDTLYDHFSPLLDVYLQVNRHYVRPVNEQALLRGAIDGMLQKLDPYSTYFTEQEYEEFQKQTQGEFPGIGVHVTKPAGVGLLIVSPMEGSPAFRAGLRPGDHITHVDGVKTTDLPLERCVKMISGPVGTSVTLTIRRPGVEDPFDVTLFRSVVSVPTIRGWARTADFKWDYLIDPKWRIGYLRILSFEARTDEQFNSIVRDLLANHRLRGLVLDVRDNSGGLLDVVVAMTNRLLDEGVIVSTKGKRTPELPYLATREDTYPDFPLAVIVNGGSASASEILAGALRDHDRATLVGEKTFGKGSVQEILPVENDAGWLKLTTSYYHLPSGDIIDGKGIMPDRIVDLTPAQREAMLTSWQAVYAMGDLPPSLPRSAPATGPETAPTTMPSATHPADPLADTTGAGLRPEDALLRGWHGSATSAPDPSPPPSAREEAEPTATASTSRAEYRYEILIDPQLSEALEVVREKIQEQQGVGTPPVATQ